MKIVFMGTPQFACPSLVALAEAGHEITAVVTRPDKPAGRGRKVAPPPVKETAEKLGLPVLQPAKVNDEASVSALRALAPDVVVVTAFGAILHKPLLTLGRLGAVNVHASLLPAYRGVAPAQWSLIHGRRTTGVTTMLMDEGVDTGPILERRVLEVRPLETAGELLARLAEVGGALLVETLEGLEEGTLRPLPQPEKGASYAPRLERGHGYLDLSRPAAEVLNQFRGTTPAPGARVFVGEESILVGAVRAVPEASGPPYTVLEIAHRHLRVAAGGGAVDLLQVRPPGKGDMEGAAFARGRRLSPGDRLTPPPELPDLSLRIAVAR
jgi:methionyl-tRNA formyltransferase